MTEIKIITWEDAYGCPAGWEYEDEIEQATSIVRSVGFVIAENEEAITLVPHIGGINRVKRQYAGAMTLPKRQIISSFSCQVPGSEQSRRDV